MNTDEAIKQLQTIKQEKTQKESDQSTNVFAKGLNTFKNIIVTTMSELTKLVISNRYEVSVKNFPKAKEIQKVEITNHQKPEPRKEIEKVEVINFPQEKKDPEMAAHMKKMEMGGEKTQGALQSFVVGQQTATETLANRIDEVVSAVKKLKLDPQIKVSSPEIKIPAPIVNIPETKIPAFPKEIEVSNLDFTEVVARLEEVVTELQYNAKQPITVGNPGDFPVSVSTPSFKKSDGTTTSAVVGPSNEAVISILNEWVSVPYTRIDVTYPNTSTDVFTYKNGSTTVGQITVTYSDATTKEILLSVVKTA